MQLLSQGLNQSQFTVAIYLSIYLFKTPCKCLATVSSFVIYLNVKYSLSVKFPEISLRETNVSLSHVLAFFPAKENSPKGAHAITGVNRPLTKTETGWDRRSYRLYNRDNSGDHSHKRCSIGSGPWSSDDGSLRDVTFTSDPAASPLL